MRENQDPDRIDRPEAGARDAMLVSCIRCDLLHPPKHPLAFHPVCTDCA